MLLIELHCLLTPWTSVDGIIVNNSRNTKECKRVFSLLPFLPVQWLQRFSTIKFTIGKFSTAFNKGTSTDILGTVRAVKSLKLDLRAAIFQFHALFTLASFSMGAYVFLISNLPLYLRPWLHLPSPSCHLPPLSIKHYGGCFFPQKSTCTSSGFSLFKGPSLQALQLANAHPLQML